jgi:NAD(P)-dependent dehydrogenase (short-subunit alcohol dehydrogenase family)
MTGLRLDGKVAFVTGAASGLGLASALRFGAEGAKVAFADLDGAPPPRRQRSFAQAAVAQSTSRWLNARAATVPLGRLGDPRDVANLALFLVSDEASGSLAPCIRWTEGSPRRWSRARDVGYPTTTRGAAPRERAAGARGRARPACA